MAEHVVYDTEADLLIAQLACKVHSGSGNQLGQGPIQIQQQQHHISVVWLHNLILLQVSNMWNAVPIALQCGVLCNAMLSTGYSARSAANKLRRSACVHSSSSRQANVNGKQTRLPDFQLVKNHQQKNVNVLSKKEGCGSGTAGARLQYPGQLHLLHHLHHSAGVVLHLCLVGGAQLELTGQGRQLRPVTHQQGRQRQAISQVAVKVDHPLCD